MVPETLKPFSEAFELLVPVTSSVCTRRVFVAACFSEINSPCGGHKMLYRHVDILNKHGIPASVLHLKPGFRYTWFPNSTEVTYLAPGTVNMSDILVVPETLGPAIGNIARGVKKVIFNQNCYYTFAKYPPHAKDLQTPYEDSDVLGALVVSENSFDYLRYAFPALRLYRIRHSIDPLIFHPTWPKERWICCMPRKRRHDLLQVLNILKFRRVLVSHGYTVMPIDGKPESEVGDLLSRCSIFLSTSDQEGFGLSAAEAMACACVVVGFHGEGGKEFMTTSCTYPIESGNIVHFARTIEDILTTSADKPDFLRSTGERAAEFIRRQYNRDLEEADVLGAWNLMFQL